MDKTTACALIMTHLIEGGNFEYDKIASKLAAEDPVMFARFAGLSLKDDTRGESRVISSMKDDTRWESRAISFMKDGQTIAAIKELRAATGMGLRDSKDAVDYYQAGARAYLSWEGMQQCSRDAVRSLRDYSGTEFL